MILIKETLNHLIKVKNISRRNCTQNMKNNTNLR